MCNYLQLIPGNIHLYTFLNLYFICKAANIVHKKSDIKTYFKYIHAFLSRLHIQLLFVCTAQLIIFLLILISNKAFYTPWVVHFINITGNTILIYPFSKYVISTQHGCVYYLSLQSIWLDVGVHCK